MEQYVLDACQSTTDTDTAKVRIVSQSSQNPAVYPTITAALQAAASGDTILIQPGIYHEPLVIDKAVSLIGTGKPADVVIDVVDLPCLTLHAHGIYIEGISLRSHFVFPLNHSDATCIAMGLAEIVDCDLSSTSATCLLVSGPEAVVTVRRCRIHDSQAYGVLVDLVGTCTIEHSIISGHTLAEVAVLKNSTVSLLDCTLCHGDGYGVLVQDCSQGCLRHCDIYGHAEAGVLIAQGSVADIVQSTIHDGRGPGVVFRQDAHGLMEQCRVYKNTSSGVEIRQQSNPIIRQCKIFQGKWSGILIGERGYGIVEYCELLANAMAGIDVIGESDPVIRFCRIHQHVYLGIAVFQGGRGTVVDCDLSKNMQGPLLVATGSYVVQERNRS